MCIASNSRKELAHTVLLILMAAAVAYEFGNNGAIVVKGEYRDGYKAFRYLENMRYKGNKEYVRVLKVNKKLR